VIVRFGNFETTGITLEIGTPAKSVPIRSPLSISGTVRAVGSPTNVVISLFLVVDVAVGSAVQLPVSFIIGASFTLSFVPGHYGITIGNHRLSFYAVDADGDVSEPQVVVVKVEAGSRSPDSPEPPEEQVSSTVVAIIGAIAGSAVIIVAVLIALLCYRRKRGQQKVVLGKSDTDSGTEGLKAWMAD
jgi:hypothetical protein